MLSVKQRQLNLKYYYYYYNGEIDNIEGSLMRRGYREFQSDHKLKVDGIYGIETDTALIAAIKELQRKLNAYGNYGLVIDGLVGEKTIAAIKDVQKKNNLKVDGLAGPATFNILNGTKPEPAPTPKGKVIVVNAGHGGSDPGAVYQGNTEKERNLKIANYLAAYLKAQGHTVYMTRDKDVYMSLPDRATYANNRKAACYISIHNNAGGGDGCEFIYYPTSNAGKRLAECMKNAVVAGTGQNFRRHIARDDADVRLTQMPAVIVECAFMDNPTDYAIIATDEGCRKMGEAIGKGVINWFE